MSHPVTVFISKSKVSGDTPFKFKSRCDSLCSSHLQAKKQVSCALVTYKLRDKLPALPFIHLVYNYREETAYLQQKLPFRKGKNEEHTVVTHPQQ